jgi:glucokinase-like ROK family protein
LKAVLLSFLHEGEISRIQLSKHTGLSTTTITNLITELIEEGIVVEEGAQEEEGRRRVGRPRSALRLQPNARYAIGVHLGIGLHRVAITNLHAEVVNNRISTFDIKASPVTVFEGIIENIESLIQESGIDANQLLGVGIGASGLVDVENGINVLAPNLGWVDQPIRQIFSNRLPYPVVVDNNVRAMALGEAYFGSGRGINSLVFVYGRVGVGAGIIFNGQIFRGSHAGAGEIGHTTMVLEGGAPCRCGNNGCLETLVTEPILIERARNIASIHPNGLLASHLESSDGVKEIDSIFAAALHGDQEILSVIREQACYLGIALANLVNVLNPEAIILGGLFAQGGDIIIPIAAQAMRERAFARLGDSVKILPTSFGWRAGVIGAASLALFSFFYQEP